MHGLFTDFHIINDYYYCFFYSLNATEQFDRSCMQQANCKDLLVVQWWWRGSRRSPPKTGTEIRPTERNFHGSRCPGHRGTPGTSPRQSRVEPGKRLLPAKMARHLAPMQRKILRSSALSNSSSGYYAFTSHFSWLECMHTYRDRYKVYHVT